MQEHAQVSDILHIRALKLNGVSTSQNMFLLLSILIQAKLHPLITTNVQTDSFPALENLDASTNAQMDFTQLQDHQDAVVVQTNFPKDQLLVILVSTHLL